MTLLPVVSNNDVLAYLQTYGESTLDEMVAHFSGGNIIRSWEDAPSRKKIVDKLWKLRQQGYVEKSTPTTWKAVQ